MNYFCGWSVYGQVRKHTYPIPADAYSYLLEVGCMQVIKPVTPQIIHIIGLSGIFGVSMIISLLSDLLALMTLHVYCFYMVAARIFNWQLIILYSLFNLFRGKKRNMLRNRIDACDYDLDQLLLGTCLFTLLTFLFPTVVIYYLTFALVRKNWPMSEEPQVK